MDTANMSGGIVIGTGDLSEIALGWATYNGDHMSMYGVNSGVPKTLVRYLVAYVRDFETPDTAAVLDDILKTPVSPELLPASEGAQNTEEIVGPYELHDFFLYYFVRCCFAPEKILRIAKAAWNGVYSAETIEKWLKVFIKRFFSQQFKRSCLPDGVKIGSVSLSPRADFRMPSDMSPAFLQKPEQNIEYRIQNTDLR
jgi:NAD+ synthase (glutamine-hydrolysing)